MPKSFCEKRDEDKGYPKVEPLTAKAAARFGLEANATILIPSAQEVDACMRKPRKGQLLTVNQIREQLAKTHRTDVACPIVTGIYARIAAGAAGEELEAGKRRVTPYWRTLKSKGELNEKYPGGREAQRQLLEDEGHNILEKGKRWLVEDFESSLASL